MNTIKSIFSNQIIGTAFVAFWSVFILFFGLSCVCRPKYSVTYTYPNHKIEGVALDQATFYTTAIGLLSLLIGSFGLYSLKSKQDLKAAILVFCVMTLGGGIGDFYQFLYHEHFGSNTIFALSSINFQLVLFIAGVLSYFSLPKFSEKKNIPKLVKYYFLASSIYLAMVSVPGVVYPPSQVETHFSFTSKDERQVSQVNLFAWLFYFYLFICSLISFHAKSAPHPVLVLGSIILYFIGCGLCTYQFVNRENLHSRLVLPIALIFINACFSVFGMIIIRQTLPTNYIKVEKLADQQEQKSQHKVTEELKVPESKSYEPQKGYEHKDTYRAAEHRTQHKSTEQSK